MNYYDIGIDLGSTSTKIFIKGYGLVANMSSVVAVNKYTGELIDIGQRAYNMLGRVPGFVTVKRPLVNGVIVDYSLAKLLINEILSRVLIAPVKHPRLFVCVHSSGTDFEKFTLINSIFSCRNGDIFLIEEPVASGFGAGFNLNYSQSLIIVNIGGGTTDIAYVESKGAVRSFSTKIGGQIVDEAIRKNVFEKYKMKIGQLTSEKLKIDAANLVNCSSLKTFKLKGKDAVTGFPKSIFLSQKDVFSLIEHPVGKIIDEISYFVYSIPKMKNFNRNKIKIVLTGGGSLIKGLPEYIENILQIKTKIALDPIGCAICGLGELFETGDWKEGGFVKPA